MAGTIRRNKPLKAKTVLSDISEFLIANPANGDLLVFNSGTSLWQNTKVLTGNYTLAGDLSLSTLSASGLVTLADSLTVADALTVSGASSLQGTFAVGGAATLSSTLGVTGAVTLSNALSVTGTLTGAGFSFSGNGTVTGTLGVTGILTAGVLNPASIVTTGDVSVGGNFDVAGLSFFTDDVLIGGNLSAAAIAGTGLSTTGTLSVDGTAIVGGTLIVGGASIQFGVTGTLSHDLTDVILHNLLTSGHINFTGIQTDGLTTHTMLRLDPDAGAELFFNAFKSLATIGQGIDIFDSVGVQPRFFLKANDGTLKAGYQVASDVLFIDNFSNGFNITFRGRDAGGVTQSLFKADPDGASEMYNAGSVTIIANPNGVALNGASTNNPATGGSQDTRIQFQNFSGTRTGLYGWFGSTTLVIENEVHGGAFNLQSEDAGGTGRVLLSADPDGALGVYFAGTLELVTKSGGIRIDDELEIDGALNHDGTTVGLYGTVPAVQSVGYTRGTPIVEVHSLAPSASATVTNNNSVLAALIADLQSRGFIG